MSNLVKKLHTHHHTNTCRKKKSVACRLNAPWPPTNKTRIVCFEEKIEETILKQTKELSDRLIFYVLTISYLSDVTQSEILEECEVTAEQYGNALECVEKRYLYHTNENHVK